MLSLVYIDSVWPWYGHWWIHSGQHPKVDIHHGPTTLDKSATSGIIAAGPDGRHP